MLFKKSLGLNGEHRRTLDLTCSKCNVGNILNDDFNTVDLHEIYVEKHITQYGTSAYYY